MSLASVYPRCPRCGGPLYPDVPDRFGYVDYSCIYCGEVEYDQTPARPPIWRGQGRGRPQKERTL